MQNVMNKAQELAHAILESDIYQRVHAAESQVTTDPGASEAIAAYMEKRQAVETLFHCPVISVSAGIKTGLNMKIDHPHMLGSDLVCLAVESVSRGKLPCVAVDMGTATTFTVVNQDGVMVGTAIAPGVHLGL